MQPEANIGRILAAYGRGFVAGALVCLVGVAIIIMYAPRDA